MDELLVNSHSMTRSGRSTMMKRMVALLSLWEKREAGHHPHQEESDSDEDDEVDPVRLSLCLGAALKISHPHALQVDCFGSGNDRPLPFDWKHAAFSALRAMLLFPFSIVYLFSRRFSLATKMILLLGGVVNVAVVAIPVLAFVWTPGHTIMPETSLVWSPLVVYLILCFVQTTVDGRWKDAGGEYASLLHLERYQGIVRLQDGQQEEIRASELIKVLISEEERLSDAWEYPFLLYILSPTLGVINAGLFLLIDYLLRPHFISHGGPASSALMGIAMLLNCLTLSIFLGLLSLSAYVFRRQLILLRFIAGITSKKYARKHSVPHLCLDTPENVKMWAAMRSFATADKSYLPLTSAGAIMGSTFIVTGVLWVLLLVSVFADRTRAQLYAPINMNIGFFALVLLYFLIVNTRQHVMINKALRSHPILLRRQGFHLQLSIEQHGASSLEPASRLISRLADVYFHELSVFRVLGFEILQQSANSLLGVFLTLAVATISNFILDSRR